jgi:pilus assembly protein CpaB
MTPAMRNMLLIVGAFALLAGVLVGGLWLRSGVAIRAPVAPEKSAAVLVAAHPIAAGTLLRQSDIGWQTVKAAQPPAGSFSRGVNSQAELVGALTRRNLAAGEILTTTGVLRPNELGFLAATLVPGYRAVTIPIDARQSASGLVLPGDRVDVILVQDLADKAPAQKSVGETVLYNSRVLAVGHALGPTQKAAASTLGDTSGSGGTTPQTITLEARPLDAQRLFVAGEIGKLELSLRAIGEPGGQEIGSESHPISVWAGDVSGALRGASSSLAAPRITGSIPRAARHADQPRTDAPVLIIRGSKGDNK